MEHITRSFEDYLEAVLICEKKIGKVKAVNLCEVMEISRPAVAKMLKLLESENLITRERNVILLSLAGREIAEKVFQKHNVVKDFLIRLGVSENTAEVDCCKIEHCISNETFLAIKKFTDK